MNAVCLAGMLPRYAVTPELIDLRRHDLKVPRIDAMTNSAEMIDFESGRDRRAERAVEPSVCQGGAGLGSSVEHAIPTGVCSASP